MKTKNKAKTPLKRLSLLAFLILCTLTLAYDAPKEFSLLSLVKRYVKNDFVKKDLDDKKLEYGAVKGMLESLDDPYTRFMEPKNYKEMKVRMNGEFYGIGIHIGIRDKLLTVISPIEGTPADAAGLQAMDRIMKIDDKPSKGLGLNEAVNIIRGPKGSEVVLNIYREGVAEQFDVPIIRDKITIKAVNKVEAFDDGIGYIRLSTFESRQATEEMEAALKELKKKQIKGLVLDLRNNGGGLLSNAIKIAGLFISQGDVVHTVDRNDNRQTEYVYGNALFKKPMVVLINQGSASASEILAGAIHDNGRGKLVGHQSFGKASVQKVINLPDRSAILLTTAKYLTPSGVDISAKGVSVNVEVKVPTENIEASREADYEYKYENDVQLQKAIQVLKEEI